MVGFIGLTLPLSFEGTGFIDIGLTRLLWLALLTETNTGCITLSTFLSEKISLKKKKKGQKAYLLP